jgi:hypothetical protein
LFLAYDNIVMARNMVMKHEEIRNS